MIDDATASAGKALCERLGYRFTDLELLALAVTHRSFSAENPGAYPNERLEFLGDAVLGVVVTEHIFLAYPELPEGELAKLRASVVSAATLAAVAEDLDLGSVVRLGKGEAASGGSSKPSILADALEAVLGAVFLDGGLDAVRPLVLDLLDDRISTSALGPGGQDFKTRLQELAARHFEQLPAYEVRDEGPDHEKRFFATVLLDGRPRGTGEGRSKKLSEQSAARSAWERLVVELEGEAAEPIATRSPAATPSRSSVPRTIDASIVLPGASDVVPTATTGSRHPESEGRDA
jgi:ribonuclease-3